MKRFLLALLSILAIAWPAVSKAQEGSESRSVRRGGLFVGGGLFIGLDAAVNIRKQN